MGTWLESYDIMYWEKDGKVYISRGYPEIIHELTKQGYVFRCDGSEINASASHLLDEEMGAVEFRAVLPKKETKEHAKKKRSMR